MQQLSPKASYCGTVVEMQDENVSSNFYCDTWLFLCDQWERVYVISSENLNAYAYIELSGKRTSRNRKWCWLDSKAF